MSASSIITTLGISLLLVYGLTRILEFYGIGINVYGSYIAFYFFILISTFILPREYPRVVLQS
jgi:branched-subunit amino acid ABC-type transport system permease component